MITFKRIFLIMLTGGLIAPLLGQGGDGLFSNRDKEEIFRASTKQVNQFFRRFNGEEDTDGNKYQPEDKHYRDFKTRRVYLPMLIDEAVLDANPASVQKFIKYVNDRKAPIFLDNHTDDWVVEVNCVFREKGKDVGIMLMMRLQAQGQGYEWVIESVANPAYEGVFDKDESEDKPFIHPMSHELEFMNLRKAFNGVNNPASYTLSDFHPDYLSVFLYQLQKKELEFKNVQSVRFHFFVIPGWYFEISEYNRPEFSSGWLISNLVEVSDDQKQQLKDYIYGQ